MNSDLMFVRNVLDGVHAAAILPASQQEEVEDARDIIDRILEQENGNESEAEQSAADGQEAGDLENDIPF